MAETQAASLAEEYLKRGGQRRAIVDDNLISTRTWEDEPEEAKRFWNEHIAPLPKASRDEVESLLPSISDTDA